MLLLIAGGRVDAWGSHLRSFASLHPDNPVTETGVLSELSASGTSRSGRSDRRHHLLDPVIVAGPWAAAAGPAPGATGAACRVHLIVRDAVAMYVGSAFRVLLGCEPGAPPYSMIEPGAGSSISPANPCPGTTTAALIARPPWVVLMLREALMRWTARARSP